MSALNYFDTPIISAGLTTLNDAEGYETLVLRDIRDKKEARIRKAVLKDETIRGMMLAGNVERAGFVFNLMKNKVNVEKFKHELIAGGFNLLVLPEALGKQFFRRS
jgi:NAD(P)H-nitrite reductase large subunit